MNIIFIILLLSVIVTILFMPRRYPIEHYNNEELGAANKWGGVPRTEEDYEKLENELIKQKELMRKKDQEIKDKVKECKKENEEIVSTLTKKSEELEKNEKEAVKQKNDCESKSVNCIKDAAEATSKLEKMEAKFKTVEECCEKQKAVAQEAQQQNNVYKTEIATLKLRLEGLMQDNKKLEDSNKFLKTTQASTPVAQPAQASAATAAAPVGPRPAPAGAVPAAK
jgi:chromosome segregation ATPase